MRSEVSIFCERLAAKLALKGLFTGMSIHMDLEPPRSLVVLSANIALKRLFTRMNHLVRLEVPLRDELLLTIPKVASKRSVASVRPHVNFEVTCLLEMLQTIRKRTN